jgi:hypothetical protein
LEPLQSQVKRTMVDKENFFRLALYGPGYALAMAAPQYCFF